MDNYFYIKERYLNRLLRKVLKSEQLYYNQLGGVPTSVIGEEKTSNKGIFDSELEKLIQSIKTAVTDATKRDKIIKDELQNSRDKIIELKNKIIELEKKIVNANLELSKQEETSADKIAILTAYNKNLSEVTKQVDQKILSELIL